MLDIRDTFTPLVRRVFGESARFDGDIGTPQHPGSVRIILGDVVLGSGASFATALADASGRVTSACRPTARKSRIVLAC